MLGRLPLGGEDAVLLSYSFSYGAFHADSAVAGRAVTINGRQSRSPACCRLPFARS